MKIESNFAILDVRRGRATLAHQFTGCPRTGPTPVEYRIPVTIHGYISCVHSGDDGESQEFSVAVERLEMFKK